MGNYVNNTLIRDEHVVYETKLHWILFCKLKALFSLFIVPAIDRTTSEFVITNRRVVIKVGWFNHDAFEMNLSKIESVNISQSFIARILGYGTIIIVGTGGSKEMFHNISKPKEFKRQFMAHAE
ncbi:PH domain-containing protein [Desulforhopalus vacuolatus]|uniref:PH domain-containing protein n=1 Tax=Desulforhopalus vacuolatus TaxID=40414 RepID=UPI00196442CE|nr:PH domain-containing protein [Desulforhopalus vacuolatus]MBM9519977.1 PH domain-containing protein [Desulforhopalus vacuolatus]